MKKLTISLLAACVALVHQATPSAQPKVYVDNDVKSCANASGPVALWIDRGTVTHFRAVSIKPM